MATLEDLEAYI